VKEDMYWQQRSKENWILKGDVNTNIFNTCANGRRRKARICSLESDQGVITEQKDIEKHVVDFYKNLFGSNMDRGTHLVQDFWDIKEKLEPGDREFLMTPLSKPEVSKAILGMRSNSATGPNGFTITFFNHMWERIKDEIMKMVHDFNRNQLDLKRLNYGVITLVPKIKEANSIK
jgi:hypothetical protein